MIIPVLLCCVLQTYAQDNNSGIIIEKKTGHPRLMVNNKPFLILGGELGNSSASNAGYLAGYWKRLQDMHLNTVLLPVYWELIEPEENKFDFSLLDSAVVQARLHNLNLVLLWFGTWKNSMSCYAPAWMKTNPVKFIRTADNNGRSQEIFSVFGKATLDADKKAFSSLMKHVKESNQSASTIIMVQVENEIGMLTTAREFSAVANSYYNDPVPTELVKYLQQNKDRLTPEMQDKWASGSFLTNGSWEKTFGAGLATQEMFQAWHYAKYANEVARAGKKVYDIPMYVNAALPRPGKLPGEYPSAGPLPQVMDIWQAAAPSIDMLSPDFYNPDTKYWCDLYTRNSNTLFVPEMRFDKTCAAKVFFIIGHYNAIGFSPFSIENENSGAAQLGNSYSLLQQLVPVIEENKWTGIDGFLFDKNNPVVNSRMGKYNLRVSHESTMGWSAESKDSVWSTAGGMIIQTAPDEFLVAGTGVVAVFSNADSNYVTNILNAEEISFKGQTIVTRRRMNGDEDHQGRHVRIPVGEWSIQRIKLYNSPAAVR